MLLNFLTNLVKQLKTINSKYNGNHLASKWQKFPGIIHQKIFPRATYSPWINDIKFQSAYQIAKNYTLIDEYRMYELYQLALQAAKLNGDFLEVGVWRGGSSAMIQSAIKNLDSKNRFYIADTFKGVVKAGSVYDTKYKGGEHNDAKISDVKRLFKQIKLSEPKILVGIFPDEYKTLDIKKIVFVHCDVDAYESTKDIIEWCIPKMVKGGVIVLDDYGFSSCEGVTSYVNFIAQDLLLRKNFRFIYNLNGHAILIKL